MVARRRGNTVIRAAYGIHYDQSSLALSAKACTSARRTTISTSSIPIQGLLNLSLSNPFPSNFPFPIPPRRPRSSGTCGRLTSSNGTSESSSNWASLAWLEVAYVGSKGTALIDSRNINQPAPSTNPNPLRPNPYFADVDIIESNANSIYHSLQARFEQRLSNGLSALASYTYSKSIDDASGFFYDHGRSEFSRRTATI